jgi:hypothetical protein
MRGAGCAFSVGADLATSARPRNADWRAGRLKLPDLDDHEWIPLPSDPPPPVGPMS